MIETYSGFKIKKEKVEKGLKGRIILTEEGDVIVEYPVRPLPQILKDAIEELEVSERAEEEIYDAIHDALRFDVLRRIVE